MKKQLVILLCLITVFFTACSEEFDDPTMSILKKTEIICITLDPPEAMPGDIVTARVLVADETGLRDDLATVWATETNTPQSELNGQSVSFIVPEIPESAYNQDGFAPLMVSVAVAKTSLQSIEQLTRNANQLMEKDEILFGIRTLTISKRTDTNANPEIIFITSGEENIQVTRPTIARFNSLSFDTERSTAMENPLRVTENEEMFFQAHANAHSDSTDLLYQWICTGGDFKGRRKKLEPWIAPKYKTPTVSQGPDTPYSPNLYPVWVIVRDDGLPHELGQSVAMFYVQIEKKTAL